MKKHLSSILLIVLLAGLYLNFHYTKARAQKPIDPGVVRYYKNLPPGQRVDWTIDLPDDVVITGILESFSVNNPSSFPDTTIKILPSNEILAVINNNQSRLLDLSFHSGFWIRGSQGEKLRFESQFPTSAGAPVYLTVTGYKVQ